MQDDFNKLLSCIRSFLDFMWCKLSIKITLSPTSSICMESYHFESTSPSEHSSSQVLSVLLLDFCSRKHYLRTNSTAMWCFRLGNSMNIGYRISVDTFPFAVGQVLLLHHFEFYRFQAASVLTPEWEISTPTPSTINLDWTFK